MKDDVVIVTITWVFGIVIDNARGVVQNLS